MQRQLIIVQLKMVPAQGGTFDWEGMASELRKPVFDLTPFVLPMLHFLSRGQRVDRGGQTQG